MCRRDSGTSRPRITRPGGQLDRLVSFRGFRAHRVEPGGHPAAGSPAGPAFMGPFLAPPPKFLHGFRGRMDERIDFVAPFATALRVNCPELPPAPDPRAARGLHVETPTTQVWRRLYDEAKLSHPGRSSGSPNRRKSSTISRPIPMKSTISRSHRRIAQFSRACERRRRITPRTSATLVPA